MPHPTPPARLLDLLTSSGPPGYGNATMHNGAVAGTLSRFMSLCHKNHLPEDLDVAIVEYSINDMPGLVGVRTEAPAARTRKRMGALWVLAPPWAALRLAAPLRCHVIVSARRLAACLLQDFDSDQRRGFERLLRKLLNYPKRPAVIILNVFAWKHFNGSYFQTAEAGYSEFASYYDLPMLSLKAAAHQLMVEGAEGFWVNTTRQEWQAKDLDTWVAPLRPPVLLPGADCAARAAAQLDPGAPPPCRSQLPVAQGQGALL